MQLLSKRRIRWGRKAAVIGTHTHRKWDRKSAVVGILTTLALFYLVGDRALYVAPSRMYLAMMNGPVDCVLSTMSTLDSERHPMGILRYDWTRLRRLNRLTQLFAQHQCNCSLPFLYFRLLDSGMGSSLHYHSQFLCHVMEEGQYRRRTQLPWPWHDSAKCAVEGNHTSALECYFPQAEPTCPGDEVARTTADMIHGFSYDSTGCPNIVQKHGSLARVRAATSEYLFTRVSHTLQNEAERQIPLVFATYKGGVVPPNLIVVHIRWGDKIAFEMSAVPIERYLHAVRTALDQRNNQCHACWNASVTDVHILLATEDPEARKAFVAAAPRHWHVYMDQFYTEYAAVRVNEPNNHVHMASQLGGRPGLVTLGSLLVAMEANTFILTTASNWSRLMNELRKNVLNPRVGNCTIMIDLLHDEW